MDLYEYQAKELFLKFNLPVLNHWVCSNILDIKNYESSIVTSGPPWVVKCQIHSGGRGKAGGIKIVHSLSDIISFTDTWIGKKLVTYQTTNTGETVNHILIEPAIKIIHEFYLSVLIDRDAYKIICIVSSKGGVNIEDSINESSNYIHKIDIDPKVGAYSYQGRILANKLGLNKIYLDQFVKIYINIVRMLLKKDLMLVEINPLVINNNNLICLDAKVSVDDNALFRQSNILDIHLKNNIVSDTSSLIFKNLGINYVALNGNIGCMVNGAGLAMATMDLIKSLGGSPANFLDIGGDTNQKSIISALQILLNQKQIKVILINIFGGIVCCNLVADSIISSVHNYVNHIPIVVRLEGNNSILGINKLKNNYFNIFVIKDLNHAIKQTIELVNKNVDSN